MAERLRGEYGLSETHVELLGLAAGYPKRLTPAQFADTLQAMGGVWAPDQFFIGQLREPLGLPPS